MPICPVCKSDKCGNFAACARKQKEKRKQMSDADKLDEWLKVNTAVIRREVMDLCRFVTSGNQKVAVMLAFKMLNDICIGLLDDIEKLDPELSKSLGRLG